MVRAEGAAEQADSPGAPPAARGVRQLRAGGGHVPRRVRRRAQRGLQCHHHPLHARAMRAHAGARPAPLRVCTEHRKGERLWTADSPGSQARATPSAADAFCSLTLELHVPIRPPCLSLSFPSSSRLVALTAGTTSRPARAPGGGLCAHIGTALSPPPHCDSCCQDEMSAVSKTTELKRRYGVKRDCFVSFGSHLPCEWLSFQRARTVYEELKMPVGVGGVCSRVLVFRRR